MTNMWTVNSLGRIRKAMTEFYDLVSVGDNGDLEEDLYLDEDADQLEESPERFRSEILGLLYGHDTFKEAADSMAEYDILAFNWELSEADPDLADGSYTAGNLLETERARADGILLAFDPSTHDLTLRDEHGNRTLEGRSFGDYANMEEVLFDGNRMLEEMGYQSRIYLIGEECVAYLPPEDAQKLRDLFAKYSEFAEDMTVSEPRDLASQQEQDLPSLGDALEDLNSEKGMEL